MTLSGILNDEFTTISKEPSSIVCIKEADDYKPIQCCFSLGLLKRSMYKAIVPLGVLWLAQKYGLSVDFFSKPPKNSTLQWWHIRSLKTSDMRITVKADCSPGIKNSTRFHRQYLAGQICQLSVLCTGNRQPALSLHYLMVWALSHIFVMQCWGLFQTPYMLDGFSSILWAMKHCLSA